MNFPDRHAAEWHATVHLAVAEALEEAAGEIDSPIAQAAVMGQAMTYRFEAQRLGAGDAACECRGMDVAPGCTHEASA